MKTNTIFITSLFLMCIGVQESMYAGDSFRINGRLNLHAGVGFGIHYLSTNQVADKDGAGLTGHMRFGVDYGIARFITLGAVVFRNGFATNKDSSEQAENGGVGLYANLNLFRGEKTIFYPTVGFGYSGLFYENFKRGGKASSNGIYLLVGLGFRRYFGSHFGLFVQGDFSTYQYKELKDESGIAAHSNPKWEMGVTGFEIKTGLVYAFGKK